jgi:hypothetical protein
LPYHGAVLPIRHKDRLMGWWKMLSDNLVGPPFDEVLHSLQ